MNYFYSILKLSIQHDYFNSMKCPVVSVSPTLASQRILTNYQWIFKKTDINEWMLVGDSSHALSGLSDSATVTIELDATVADPKFLYYTPALLPDRHTGGDIQYEESGSYRTFRIKLSFTVRKPDEKSNSPTDVCIYYKSLSRYWEYILLPRTLQQQYTKDLYLSDMEGVLAFAPATPVEWNGHAGYSIRTIAPIELKEHYPAKIHFFENKRPGKKMLKKNISPPTPGRFISSQNDTIQEIIYF